MGMSELLGPQGGAAALKEAMDNTDEGTKKQAVARAADPTPAATATEGKADGPPDKYNVPRKDGESIEDHISRLAVLRAAYDKLHPRE